jgi:single-stranded DNA-binding protein
MRGIECAFTGRLGREAERRLVKSGKLPMVIFSAAIDEQQQAADTPAHRVRVVLCGGKAEELAPRLTKGIKVYVEGRLTTEFRQPSDGRAARINLQVVANVLQPIGQIGRQRRRATRTAERGHRTWDRSGDADRANDAKRPFYDDMAEVVADLERRGR